MSDDPHAEGGPPTYTQPGARAPSHAERTRTLVAAREDGALSTLALEPAGHPYGSVAPYAVGEDGLPLVLMSSMAAHAQNLAADPRCCLLVSAAGPGGTDRLGEERASLLGDMAPVAPEAQDAATATYRQAHPDAFWAEFPDFQVHRLEVAAVRYVRGFGEMGWVEAADYRAAEPDPLAAAEERIVEHMNADHDEHLREMVAAYLDVDGTVTGARMLSCDRYGFELRLALAAGPDQDEPGVAFGRIGFPEPLREASQARDAMVALVREAGD